MCDEVPARPDMDSATAAELYAALERATGAINLRDEQIAALRARVAELEATIGKGDGHYANPPPLAVTAERLRYWAQEAERDLDHQEDAIELRGARILSLCLRVAELEETLAHATALAWGKWLAEKTGAWCSYSVGIGDDFEVHDTQAEAIARARRMAKGEADARS